MLWPCSCKQKHSHDASKLCSESFVALHFFSIAGKRKIRTWMEARLLIGVQKIISLSCHTCPSSSSISQILAAQSLISLPSISFVTTLLIDCLFPLQNAGLTTSGHLADTRGVTQQAQLDAVHLTKSFECSTYRDMCNNLVQCRCPSHSMSRFSDVMNKIKKKKTNGEKSSIKCVTVDRYVMWWIEWS